MLGFDRIEAMRSPILLKDFLTFLDCLRRSPSRQKAVSSYFDEVLNEKPVGDRRYTISGIGFPSKMMESNGGFREQRKSQRFSILIGISFHPFENHDESIFRLLISETF